MEDSRADEENQTKIAITTNEIQLLKCLVLPPSITTREENRYLSTGNQRINERCAKSGKSFIFLATFLVKEFRKLLLLVVVHTQCLSAKGYNLIKIEIIDTHIYIYMCVCVFSVYV